MDYSDLINLPRPQLHHVPMEVRHRAKQFAPFAALKGFEDCIRRKETYILPNELVKEMILEEDVPSEYL